MAKQNTYRTGIYTRLSKVDRKNGLANDGISESLSISNQRTLLTELCKERGLILTEEYVDDGLTGVFFDRPRLQDMIPDIERGYINCVVVCDLSRLGRNYVEAGHFTEDFIVENGIRFISLAENIDIDGTTQESDGIIAFHHVMNEFYPRQVSQKVRRVKASGARQGKFMGSRAPFGFMKSPENKHQLLIDEEAAATIRYIFGEFAIGKSARSIAQSLNACFILPESMVTESRPKANKTYGVLPRSCSFSRIPPTLVIWYKDSEKMYPLIRANAVVSLLSNRSL